MTKVVFKMHECAESGFGEIYANNKVITMITGIKELDIRDHGKYVSIFIDSTLISTQLFMVDSYEIEDNANEYCNVIKH